MYTLFRSSQRVLNKGFRQFHKSFSTGGANAVIGVNSTNVQAGAVSNYSLLNVY